MYTLISNFSDANNLLSDLLSVEFVSLDTETSSLDTFTSTLYTIQLKIGSNIYILDARRLEKSHLAYIMDLVSSKIVIMHNAKFDVGIVRRAAGIFIKKVWDTQIAEAVLTAGIGDSYISLAGLAWQYCEVSLDKEVRESFYKTTVTDLSPEQLKYAAEDVMYLDEIRYKQQLALETKRLRHVADLEMRLLPVVSDMEYRGINIDTSIWKENAAAAEAAAKEAEASLIKEFLESAKAQNLGFNNAAEAFDYFVIPVKTKKKRVELEGLTTEDIIYEAVAKSLNINSNKQMLNILRNIYGIAVDSTNEKVLNKYVGNFSIIDTIFSFREAVKLADAFGVKFLDNLHPVTGRIHAEFNQLGTRSGRFASRNPNMQNIVANDRYRRAFSAPEGFVIGGFDYSQVELRVLAAVAQERGMIKAFVSNVDLHANTAAGVFEKPINEVSKSERRTGKTLNFAVVYGSSEYGLWKNFNIPKDQGRKYLEKFYTNTYPDLAAFKTEVSDTIWDKGYSITPFGRKRFFPKAPMYKDYKEYMIFKHATIRQGINHIIQGGSADIIKMAMVSIFEQNPFGDKLRPIIQVHDELVFEIAEDIIDAAVLFIRDNMLKAEAKFIGEIPPEVSTSIEKFWTK